MTPSDDLTDLARILANWVEPAPSFQIYLFGSRVRGDYKPTSDVDVVIRWGEGPTTEDVMWWRGVNTDLFKTINAQLPGPLQILENDDPLVHTVVAAPVVYQDRQVLCVWTAPKTIQL